MIIRSTLLALALALVSCSGSSSSSSSASSANFNVQRTRQAVGAAAPVIVSGRWVGYPASEAGTGPSGTDWNEDGDIGDSIFVAVNTQKRKQRVLDVAAETSIPAPNTLAFVGSDFFMIVSEINDSRDWNGDIDTVDTVLLHWTSGMSEPEFVDEIGGTGSMRMVSTGGRLYYVSADIPTLSQRTNLRAVSVDGGLVVGEVGTTFVDPGMDGLRVELAGEAGGLLALTIDENLEGEITGDADGTDGHVLCFLDGTSAGQLIAVTSKAISGEVPAWAVRERGAGDWLVGFLVDESEQGQNLNDPGLFPPGIWQPAQCIGLDDTDTDDEVLHWLEYASFAAGLTGVENTGLVGQTTGGIQSVVVAGDYVGTVSLEADEGSQAAIPPGCDLNADGDKSDFVFRWSEARVGAVPEGDSSRLHAVVASIPGGTNGVVSLGNIFVLLVSEGADGRDHDGRPGTNFNLLAARNPAGSGAWNFDHGAFVGATWMAPDGRQSDERFFVAFPESVEGFDLNGDGDTADSIPTFPERGNGLDLNFPGVGRAISSTNAGINAGGGTVFYRVSEMAQGLTDINGDGDVNDFILERGNFSSGSTNTMGTLNTIGRDAVELSKDNVRAAAFVVHEAAQGVGGTDFNDDGDTSDWVVSYFVM
ncbi:MAG: hypothetical protein GY711_12425 [bacterium]|nr:hypothetical protein [bacterium]